MVAFGFAEILLLAVMSGGVGSTDLVSLVQPKSYFESRQIVVTIDRMIDIVIAEPKDAKAQIMQLTALRQLTDDADNFKKAKNYATNREAIEEIVQGKRGKDPQGFAKEYAQRLLDKLDGKKPGASKISPLRDDAMSWFPAGATLAGAIDLRHHAAGSADSLADLLKMMPPTARTQMYNEVEKIGNVRLERVAFAFVDGGVNGDSKVFLRFTGKANPDGLIRLIQTMGRRQGEFTKSKDENDTPIAVLPAQRHEPGIGIIGDTDLIMFGYISGGGQPKKLDVAEVLEVRAKRKPHAAGGTLKDRLQLIPGKASAFLVGELPEELKREFRELDPMPTKIAAWAERGVKGIDVHAQTAMPNQDQADKLAKKIGELRKLGVAELQREMKQPFPAGFPAPPFQAMIAALENIQVQGQGDRVHVRGYVPDTLIQQLGQMGMMFAGPGNLDIAPPKFDKR